MIPKNQDGVGVGERVLEQEGMGQVPQKHTESELLNPLKRICGFHKLLPLTDFPDLAKVGF